MRAFVAYLAPARFGFQGPRGWYVTDTCEQVIAGPFSSERTALDHARCKGFEA
jgi:hypothetical protein